MTSIISKAMPNPVFYTNGKSAYERAREKEQLACVWIYKHGIATGDIVRRVVGQLAPGYENQLVRKGLLAKTKANVASVPRFFYTLTENGAALAEKNTTERIDYRYFEPWKASQSNFYHDFIIQELTLDAIEQGFLKDYKTSRSLKSSVSFQEMRWMDQNGRWIDVQVELKERIGRHKDMMVQSVCAALENEVYADIFFFSDNLQLLRTYEDAFQPGAKFRIWKMGELKKDWKDVGGAEVPEDVIDHVFFRLIGKKYDVFDPRVEEFD